MNGYEKRTQLKKGKIINAALELFSLYGIDKTSINEIAQKASVAPASVYNYFETKEGLLKEIALNQIEKSLKEREELWASNLPFPVLLKKAISNQDNFFKKINIEILERLVKSDEEVKQLADEVFNKRYPILVEKFLEKGKKEGYIHRTLSPKTAIIYLKMYQEVIQNPELYKEDNSETLRELYDLMLYGLAGQPIEE